MFPSVQKDCDRQAHDSVNLHLTVLLLERVRCLLFVCLILTLCIKTIVILCVSPKHVSQPSLRLHSGPAMSGGGLNQLIALADGTARLGERAGAKKSEVAEVLLDMWSWGEISIPKLHAFASAAKRDGVEARNLNELIRLSHPANRNMHELLPGQFKREFTSSHKLLMKITPQTFRMVDSTMILPHELFSAIWKLSPSYFVKKMCGGSADRIGKFWDRMRGHPACPPDSLLRRRADLREKCIPISIHGDGVACTGISKSWSQSSDAVSWSSLLAKGPVALTQFLVFVISWGLVVSAGPDATWTAFDRKLAWSLYGLFIGKYPKRDE